MSKSNSEVGHAKNVENFADLINFCTIYGAVYNPTKTSITLSSLQTKFTEAKSSMNNFNSAQANMVIAVNVRQQAFEPIKRLSTRIINALDASDVHDDIVRDARTLVRKIHGVRAEKIIAGENGETPATHSTSQLSFDQRIENFDRLIALLKVAPQYNPNETDLTIASLEAYLQTLRNSNSGHSLALVNLRMVRNLRNTVIYNTQSGLVKISSEVKKYVKSVYGSTAPEFKQISGIKFINKKY